MSARNIVIVDGFSSARYLPREFADYGVRCINMLSKGNVPEAFSASYAPDVFFDHIDYSPCFELLCKRISEYRPIAIIPGHEAGVVLAELLAAKFGLPGNSPKTSHLRRNKFAMIDAVQSAGLTAARQVLVSSPDEAAKWVDLVNQWPIIVKPLDGCAADGVRYCYDRQSAQAAVANLTRQRNILGHSNEQALLQTYLDGDQYIVNSVAMAGVHRLSDVTRVQLRTMESGLELVDYRISASQDDPVLQGMVAYAFAAAEAIGIREGAMHAELRKTSRGYALIEAAARMMGNTMERVPFILAQGYSPAALVAMRWADPVKFMDQRLFTYSPRKHYAIIHLRPEYPGVVRSMPALEWARELASYYGVFGAPKLNSVLHATETSVNSGGALYLIHEDRRVLEDDIALFTKWREAGQVFRIEREAQRSQIELLNLAA